MSEPIRSVAIACGGTGGHLFPGMAVAAALQQQSCNVTLLVSAKEVDQLGVASGPGFAIETLPAVALQNGAGFAFVRGFWKSYRLCSRLFARQRPQAVLAMGGFISAPPILAGRFRGATTFLHESNAIPGRANRWLSFIVDEAFVGFSSSARRLFTQAIRVTGTPIRSQFKPAEASACRVALGLDPNRPVLLIMGGSQGARRVNELVMRSLLLLGDRMPQLQFLHLTGSSDKEKVSASYQASGRRAVVRAFLTEMELALGAATVAIGRAGASSLSELAAMRLPAILIPYPAAADDHQFHNARAYVETGAAVQFAESTLDPETLSRHVCELIENTSARAAMSHALERWFYPHAAEEIAGRIVEMIDHPGMGARETKPSFGSLEKAAPGPDRNSESSLAFAGERSSARMHLEVK
ncbi:MAG: UDP-N-acetylglucosamine--N-acetylmuramyl-(pentapeptide) pyrophosphoryl-undecaprenol N-acetylglucosamine transferase [Verrucomicrobia bacterium]|nr:UDP-N-acetylglucosamine--N-acetylmuramyl-(pentapeptide) pyrophosphoryl-undecaprenol N-acetylglucosamine transferase [Verrucomicrobiota bacterium]